MNRRREPRIRDRELAIRQVDGPRARQHFGRFDLQPQPDGGAHQEQVGPEFVPDQIVFGIQPLYVVAQVVTAPRMTTETGRSSNFPTMGW